MIQSKSSLRSICPGYITFWYTPQNAPQAPISHFNSIDGFYHAMQYKPDTGQIEPLQRDYDSRAVHSSDMKNGTENSAVLNHFAICGKKSLQFVAAGIFHSSMENNHNNLSDF